MDKEISYLHPNPGWEDSLNKKPTNQSKEDETKMLGKHCILELYECNEFRLNDEAFLRTTITTAAKSAGATLINLITHHFEPQGITGLALLAESHISIHTWPEIGYAAIDIFTCGDHTMPEKACQFLCDELLAKEYSLRKIQREVPPGLTNTYRENISSNLPLKIN